MERQDNAKTVFEQYWLHARHVENQRLWITNILVILFGALLSFMAQAGVIWYISAFGLLLALFGLLMVHALRVPFLRYSRMAEAIMAAELGMGKYRRFFVAQEKKGIAQVIDKLWGVHKFYVGLFTTSVAGWCALLAYSLKAEDSATWAIFWGVAIVLPIIYRFIFGRRENAVGEELRKLQ